MSIILAATEIDNVSYALVFNTAGEGYFAVTMNNVIRPLVWHKYPNDLLEEVYFWALQESGFWHDVYRFLKNALNHPAVLLFRALVVGR